MQKALPEVQDDEELREAPSPSLQERKQQLVRDAIWEAATDLFAEQGYDETTIDDIAQKAGVSRRSFFRYFSSKSELMAHPITGFAALLTEAIDARPAGFSIPQVFEQTVSEVARAAAAHPRTRKIMELGSKYPAVREAQQSRTRELQTQVEAAYARRLAPGSSERLTASLVAALTLSVIGVIFQVWFEQGQQDVAATAEQVLSGLKYLVSDSK